MLDKNRNVMKKNTWKKVWHFLWEDDSWESWLVSVIIAYVLIRFLVYPGLGLVLGTNYPIVAVVSGSMEHDTQFDDWWNTQQENYLNYGITKESFQEFGFNSGFNKGDIMVLKGQEASDINVGDILVFYSAIKPEPIIHRVIHVRESDDGFVFTTKGDHNGDIHPFEKNIPEKDIVGTALFRIPFLGWIKIGFVCALDMIPGINIMPGGSNYMECLLS
ncbi:MAG: signal peptidase I [Candidatus Cloacimonetes bacterium]|nr:signal peptidase I [Candidatus Cloacimonadota bacterium]